MKFFSLTVSGYHRKLLKNLFLVSFFVSLGKIVGGAKEITIAWRYGICPLVDSYIFLFNLMSWPSSVLAGLLMALVVPSGISLRAQSLEESQVFFDEMFGWLLFIGAACSALAYFSVFYLLSQGYFGLGREPTDLAKVMLLPLAVTLFLNILIVYFSTWILVLGKQWNTLFEALPPVCILIAVFMSPVEVDNPLIIGTFWGFFLQFTALVLSLYLGGSYFRPKFSFSSPIWPHIFKSIPLLLFVYLFALFPGIIDQIWVARLEGGSIAVFNYSNRLFAFFSSFGTVVIGRSFLPVISGIENDRELIIVVRRWAIALFTTGGCLASLCIFFSQDIVRIFFERGMFSSSDTESVAWVFSCSLYCIPFFFPFILMTQCFFVKKKYIALLFVYMAMVVAKFFVNFFLVLSYSVSAFMISNCIMYLIGIILFFVIIKCANF